MADAVCPDCTPPCAACHWRTNDVPDLDAIEARAAAFSAYSHRDIPPLVAYVRRLEGERDVLFVAARAYLAAEGAFDRVTLAERMGRARHSYVCEAEAKYLEARDALKLVIAAMEGADVR